MSSQEQEVKEKKRVKVVSTLNGRKPNFVCIVTFYFVVEFKAAG